MESKSFELVSAVRQPCCDGKPCCWFPNDTCHQIQAQWSAIDNGTLIRKEVDGKNVLVEPEPRELTAAEQARYDELAPLMFPTLYLK